MDKKILRRQTGCLIYVLGPIFPLVSIGLVFKVVTGGDIQEYFSDDWGDSTLGIYKAIFWILIIAIAIFLISGGNFSNFTILRGYKEDDEKED